MSLVYFVASGLTYFLGAAALGIAAALPSARSTGGRAGRLASATIAVALIAVSATPAPGWAYVGGAILVLGWLVASLAPRSAAATRWRVRLRILVPLMLLAGIGLELPYHWRRQRPMQGRARMFVIGDSLSAGIGDGVVPWPNRLARDHGLAVVNLAVAGASTANGRRQADELADEDGIVVVVLGGNDIIARRRVSDFEQDLEYILTRAAARARPVVMLEIPLPPLASGYGRVQRRLAARHSATLIPKRQLAMILARPGATTDGLHLSAAGQSELADVVWRVVGDTAQD